VVVVVVVVVVVGVSGVRLLMFANRRLSAAAENENDVSCEDAPGRCFSSISFL
jgi:hypothetical protein